jgi:hypothetical protein
MTTHPNTAESPLPRTADAMASPISDIVGENFYAPEGELPDVGYQGPAPDGHCVVWVDSPGTDQRMAVVGIAVEGDDEAVVTVTAGSARKPRGHPEPI